MAKVLVVDDEQDYREQLELSLSRDGHEVKTADCGRDAIDLGSYYRPDVLVCDWMLKNGIHGLHVTEVLGTVDPDVQTILITGFPSQDVKAQAEKMQIYRFIEKPFSLDRMRMAVRSALIDEAPQRPEPSLGIIEVDTDGLILYTNSKARKMLVESGVSDADTLDELLSSETLTPLDAAAERWVRVSPAASDAVTWMMRARPWPNEEGWLLVLLAEDEQHRMNYPIVKMLLDLDETVPLRWPLKGHALLIDDDEMVRRIIHAELQNIGCFCHAAETHSVGVQLMSGDPEINVVVIDYEMANQNTALLIERLKMIRPDVIIVGHSAKDHRDELFAMGVERFLQKPWRIQDLVNAVTGRIGSCVVCDLPIPLRRPKPGYQPGHWLCCGCGAHYFAVYEADYPPEVLSNVHPADRYVATTPHPDS